MLKDNLGLKGTVLATGLVVLAGAISPITAVASNPTCISTRTIEAIEGVDYVVLVVGATAEPCEIQIPEGEFNIVGIGGGGGGGGGESTPGGRGSGGGGGGGQYAEGSGESSSGGLTLLVEVGAGGIGGAGGLESSAAGSGADGGETSAEFVGSPSGITASGGTGGAPGTSSGGNGGNSFCCGGGTGSATAGGQGGSNTTNGSVSTAINPGTTRFLPGLGTDVYGSGGGGGVTGVAGGLPASSGTWGERGPNPGDGGQGARPSLNATGEYIYGYNGGVGRDGVLVVYYPEANELDVDEPRERSGTTSNYFIAQGFDGGRSKLKNSMRSFIRKELGIRSGEVRAICTGTVRAKRWTAKKERLALARAASGCNYITSLSPDLRVELRKRLIPKGKGDPFTVRIRVFY
jgi:hypothetical protein